MRAKVALAVAALGLVVTSLPTLAMNTNRCVNKILYGSGSRLILTQPAVVTTNTTLVAPITSDTTVIRELPAVLAPTSTGVAIITSMPSDLDIRREDLGRKVDTALVGGALTTAEATELKTALATVGNAEVNFRSDGLISPIESKHLYKAMDKIASDLDSDVADDPSILGFRY